MIRGSCRGADPGKPEYQTYHSKNTLSAYLNFLQLYLGIKPDIKKKKGNLLSYEVLDIVFEISNTN